KQYDTHFYCALCGGPFAQVFRTPVRPENSQCNPITDPHCSSADIDPQCPFNLSGEENRVLPEEVVERDMSYEARRSRERRFRAEDEGRRRGVMSERRTVRQAYDGKRISVNQMKWMKNIRALIHPDARWQPYNSQLHPRQGILLTGRGLIRESDNWADAFASEEEPLDNINSNSEYPVFPERLDRDIFGFHLYQELATDRVKNFISSIPFHAECWSLFKLAVEVTSHEKNIECTMEDFEDQIWDYLRGLIGVSGEKQQADQSHSNLHAGTRKEVVTRLSAVDYREAQSGGEGWHWKHEDGCHWLVADPSYIPRGPLLKRHPNTDPLPYAPRAAIIDPFTRLPNEVILEICAYLSSSDIFCWKVSSPTVLHVGLPESYYRRFLRQEFMYLYPRLSSEIEEQEDMMQRGIKSPIDWRGSFERLRRLTRTPRHPEDGKEWAEIDIGLKNRRRIWHIIKPIAEAIVETSDVSLYDFFHAHQNAVDTASVVRGYVGARSGQQGTICTAYVGCRVVHSESDVHEDEDEDEVEEVANVRTEAIRMWYDGPTGLFTGVEFEIFDEGLQGLAKKRFGRPGSEHVDVALRDKVLAGFAFCFSRGIVCGAQAFFLDASEAITREPVDLQFSRRVGRWSADGLIRKLVASPERGNFVGLTGFLNSAGFIETVAILEENHADFLIEPPRTIPLTHHEASLWRRRLPPCNVVLREREGIATTNWRLSGSEWEIWAPGYHEDGVEVRGYVPPIGRLEKITGYYDQRFLRGLEFVYVNINGRRTSSLIGLREGDKQSTFVLSIGDKVIASVISSSDEGVHGLLFVTQNGFRSQMLGPQFLGTHKVFTPLQDFHALQNGSGTEHKEYLSQNIIGVHALYDYEDKRFLQLGLACECEEDVSVQSIFAQALPGIIPFDVKDESLGVWVDEPLPTDWIIGANPTDVGIDATYRTRRRKPFNDYSGWAHLESLSGITIYRDMAGVKFSYASGVDKCFGCVYDQVGASFQAIDHQKGERVIGIAVLDCAEGQSPELLDEGNDKTSIISASSRPLEVKTVMERILFITNFNESQLPSPVRCKTQFPEHLVAIKFDFNHDHLVSWAPVYGLKPSGLSMKELMKRLRFPWRAHDPEIVEDHDLPETAYAISTLFGDNDAGRIDAVKGYVTRSGHFCGLLFRRNGKWSDGVFGERSAYENIFELRKGESFISIFLPEEAGQRKSNALALSTNHGRTTPWFGNIENTVNARYLQTPPGYVVVGIYGAQFEKPDLYGHYHLDWLGLLYRPEETSSPKPAPPPTAPPEPQRTSYRIPDPHTGLEWIFLQARSSSAGIRLTSLLSQEDYRMLGSKHLGRAFSTFEPEKLLQISAWCAKGICSIRFHGTSAMGLITVGDWPADAEGVCLSSDEKMLIHGPGGERISSVKVAFERPGTGRIIALCFKTSFGRQKTFCGSLMPKKESRDLEGENVRELRCREGCEIVGLHGVFDIYDIYDLGLVFQKAEPLCQANGNKNYFDHGQRTQLLAECQTIF
ncbi:hypothetical protein FN846DRAFT_1003903, partial [Sphaerosporella brunnea]